MTNRERCLAMLSYKSFDRIPAVHFGFWDETLEKWFQEGHITQEELQGGRADGSPEQNALSARLGFDFAWTNVGGCNTGLDPNFEEHVVETLPDGSMKVMNRAGVIELKMPGLCSISQEFDHVLKDRKSWEELFKPRFGEPSAPSDDEFEKWQGRAETDAPRGIFVGSLLGIFRNWVGLENLSYLSIDDAPLFKEIVDTIGERTFIAAKLTLEKCAAKGLRLDFIHFWEDICCKSGPLVNPGLFAELCGPHYKRITALAGDHGIHIVSLDCDGCIDALLPIWLENGVNTMFPIEVGVWNASVAPWRESYGRKLLGVGGMNKNVLGRDKAAVDAEVERLKPLIALGGYVPCPDHRLPPDAKWELVQYYCDCLKSLRL